MYGVYFQGSRRHRLLEGIVRLEANNSEGDPLSQDFKIKITCPSAPKNRNKKAKFVKGECKEPMFRMEGVRCCI